MGLEMAGKGPWPGWPPDATSGLAVLEWAGHVLSARAAVTKAAFGFVREELERIGSVSGGTAAADEAGWVVGQWQHIDPPTVIRWKKEGDEGLEDEPFGQAPSGQFTPSLKGAVSAAPAVMEVDPRPEADPLTETKGQTEPGWCSVCRRKGGRVKLKGVTPPDIGGGTTFVRARRADGRDLHRGSPTVGGGSAGAGFEHEDGVAGREHHRSVLHISYNLADKPVPVAAVCAKEARDRTDLRCTQNGPEWVKTAPAEDIAELVCGGTPTIEYQEVEARRCGKCEAKLRMPGITDVHAVVRSAVASKFEAWSEAEGKMAQLAGDNVTDHLYTQQLVHGSEAGITATSQASIGKGKGATSSARHCSENSQSEHQGEGMMAHHAVGSASVPDVATANETGTGNLEVIAELEMLLGQIGHEPAAVRELLSVQVAQLQGQLRRLGVTHCHA